MTVPTLLQKMRREVMEGDKGGKVRMVFSGLISLQEQEHQKVRRDELERSDNKNNILTHECHLPLVASLLALPLFVSLLADGPP